MGIDVGEQKSQASICITGVGLVTPLAMSAWGNFTALRAGRTLTDRCERLPDDLESTDLVRAIGSVAFAQVSGTDPTVDLAVRVAGEALTEARVSGQDVPVMLGVSKGAMHALLACTEKYLSGGRSSDPQRQAGRQPRRPGDLAQVMRLGPQGYLASHVQRRLQSPSVRTFVAACASGLVAMDVARQQMLAPGGPRRVLVVAVEASLLPMFVQSYRRLGVLAPTTPDSYRCTPLAATRGGFVLAEQAASVLLERYEADEALPGRCVTLLDTATASEGHDLIRPAPGMPALAHVAERLIRGRAVDVLHPHATGTMDHDPAELAVLRSAVEHNPEQLPTVYAAKGAIGHGLGAAGLAAAVLAVLQGLSRERLPMPWLDQAMPCDLPLASQGPALPQVSTHAVFAAGFGGHTAGALLRVHTQGIAGQGKIPA